MLLPTTAVSNPEGVRNAVLRWTEKAGIPAVLYVKDEGYVTPAVVKSLVDAGVISWIKYAVVRKDPAEDALLRGIVDAVGTDLLVSGIGEQPAIIHWRQFGVKAYTSGCVCVAPAPSQKMLRALQGNDFDTAEAIRASYEGLENLRNAHGPIPVLHTAIELAGIAATGPLLPLLAQLPDSLKAPIEAAAKELLAH
jgi:dihydrodipicolinate synthase/N-acetylneuraminate lyase